MKDTKKKKEADNFRKQKLIYNEVCTARTIQQNSIDQINTKLNWIIVANLGSIGLTVVVKPHNTWWVIANLIFLISLIVAIVSLLARSYKLGPRLTELIGKGKVWTYVSLLSATNKHIAKDINLNSESIKSLRIRLHFSIILFVVGVVLLAMPLFLSFVKQRVCL